MLYCIYCLLFWLIYFFKEVNKIFKVSPHKTKLNEENFKYQFLVFEKYMPGLRRAYSWRQTAEMTHIPSLVNKPY